MPNSPNCYLCKCSSLLLSLDRDVRGKALWDISIICFILIQIFHYRRKLWRCHNQTMFRWSVIIVVVKKNNNNKNNKKNALSVRLTSILTLYWLVCFITRFRNNISLLQTVKNSITDSHLSHPTCVCVFCLFVFMFFTVINHVNLDTLISTNSWRPFIINVLKKQNKTKTKRLNDPGQTPSSSVFRLLLYISRQLTRCGYYSVWKLSRDLLW